MNKPNRLRNEHFVILNPPSPLTTSVIPAKAGISSPLDRTEIPAFAGMTAESVGAQ